MSTKGKDNGAPLRGRRALWGNCHCAWGYHSPRGWRCSLPTLKWSGASSLEARRGGLGVILRLQQVRPSRPDRFQPLKACEITPQMLDRLLRALRRWKFEIVPIQKAHRRNCRACDVSALRLPHIRRRLPGCRLVCLSDAITAHGPVLIISSRNTPEQDAIHQGIGAPEQNEGQKCDARPEEGQDTEDDGGNTAANSRSRPIVWQRREASERYSAAKPVRMEHACWSLRPPLDRCQRFPNLGISSKCSSAHGHVLSNHTLAPASQIRRRGLSMKSENKNARNRTAMRKPHGSAVLASNR